MAKRIRAVVRLQIPAGKANPAPPIGTALGPQGVNIMQFCKEYNARTQDQLGMVIPAEITIFEDRSFTFITKTPPVSDLLKKAAGVGKGSAVPEQGQGWLDQSRQTARDRRDQDERPQCSGYRNG